MELYRLLDEGRTAIKEGRKRPLADVIRDIRQEIADGEDVEGILYGRRDWLRIL